MCLGIWARSSKVYADLRQHGLSVPSSTTLRRRKTHIHQKPGINRPMFEWMLEEADKMGLDDAGRTGGLMWDEMAIQVDK